MDNLHEINILAIETSCDDTCAAILNCKKVLANVVNSQEDHKISGGIIPELASRRHAENVANVVDEALKISKIGKEKLSAIAFTYGPGLIGPLLVGSVYAKTFSFSLKLPLIAVNHMQGHILANFIEEPYPEFPLLNLVVSGGHTQIVKANSFYDFELLGETLDDAIGEAYDKIAKMLGFKYPGGQEIDKHAHLGNKNKYKFTKANINNLNFSFSGIKTNVKYFLEKQDKNFIKNNIDDICASVQECLLEMLLEKLTLAINITGIKNIAIGGGVACNSGLREKLNILKEKMNLKIHIPSPEYCTDNAAMIGLCGYYKFLKKDFSDYDIKVNPELNY